MIYEGSTLALPFKLQADLCVIGSGAGGATAAMVAAEAGLRVVVLEAGPLLTPGDMSQREEEMFPQLLWAGGNRTDEDRVIKIHQGRGVGGSTLHNLNLCKRIPTPIRKRWARYHGLDSLDEAWDGLYDEVEKLLTVTDVPRDRWNRHNRLLEEGCKKLGWRGGGLRHNRTGCIGAGFCELGCTYDSKNNALKVAVPRIVAAGGQIISLCEATRITWEKDRVTGVEAAAVGRGQRALGSVIIESPRVCVSGSATSTAALLLRSEVPAPEGSIGDTLRIHPAVIAAGDFGEPIHAWRGIPQTYECTEHLDFESDGGGRIWIVPAFAHPMATATMIPGLGVEHRRMMERYAHLGVLTGMLHDHTAGRVRPSGDRGLSIEYDMEDEDRWELAHGLKACADLLFAAGARRVIIPSASPTVLTDAAATSQLVAGPVDPATMEIAAAHPMGTVPMGADPNRAAVGPDGRHHHVAGLFVADGSLFPSSIGVPPQLSIYSMGLHVGRAIVNAG